MPPPMMTKSYENCKSVSRPIILAFFAIGDAKVVIKKTRRNERPESIFAPDLSEREMKGGYNPSLQGTRGKRLTEGHMIEIWNHSLKISGLHLLKFALRTSRRLQKRRDLLESTNEYADILPLCSEYRMNIEAADKITSQKGGVVPAAGRSIRVWLHSNSGKVSNRTCR